MLADRCVGAADRGGDLGEGETENLVQSEDGCCSSGVSDSSTTSMASDTILRLWFRVSGPVVVSNGSGSHAAT